MEPTRKKPVLEAQPVSAPPYVEVLVSPRLMAVTIHCPAATRQDVEILVTRATLRARSRADASTLDLFVPLPVTAEPGRYVARFHHGVCDILIARVERSD